MKRELTIMLLFAVVLTASAQTYVYGKPKVYVQATVQMFDEPNNTFIIQLKKQLKENGWIICKKQSDADYTLSISANARQFTEQVSKYRTNRTYIPQRDSVVTESRYDNARAYGRAYERNRGKVTRTDVRDSHVVVEEKEPEEYMYFVYMETNITFETDEDVLYEDVLEIKEGHTLGYKEAARIAAKDLITKICQILPSKVKRKYKTTK